jgi:hypothetical protein
MAPSAAMPAARSAIGASSSSMDDHPSRGTVVTRAVRTRGRGALRNRLIRRRPDAPGGGVGDGPR